MTEKNFRDAYNVLQQHAETLREQAEPNIDDLLTIVTESVAAYQVCRERIDAVEAALKVALDSAGVGAFSAAPTEGAKTAAGPAPAGRRSARSAPPPADPQVLDNDIPF